MMLNMTETDYENWRDDLRCEFTMSCSKLSRKPKVRRTEP